MHLYFVRTDDDPVTTPVVGTEDDVLDVVWDRSAEGRNVWVYMLSNVGLVERQVLPDLFDNRQQLRLK